jgi:hypothetical protein
LRSVWNQTQTRALRQLLQPAPLPATLISASGVSGHDCSSVSRQSSKSQCDLRIPCLERREFLGYRTQDPQSPRFPRSRPSHRLRPVRLQPWPPRVRLNTVVTILRTTRTTSLPRCSLSLASSLEFSAHAAASQVESCTGLLVDEHADSDLAFTEISRSFRIPCFLLAQLLGRFAPSAMGR